VGCRFERPPRLYLKALVLKEVCKASLRYAENLSRHTVLNTIASKGYIPIVKRVMGLGLGIGHTLKPYMRIGASEKEYSEH
jgi:hypothetical protein